jgi:hypothetical protein
MSMAGQSLIRSRNAKRHPQVQEVGSRKQQKLQNRYPLSLPEDNAGLWLEFFIGFTERGEI